MRFLLYTLEMSLHFLKTEMGKQCLKYVWFILILKVLQEKKGNIFYSGRCVHQTCLVVNFLDCKLSSFVIENQKLTKTYPKRTIRTIIYLFVSVNTAGTTWIVTNCGAVSETWSNKEQGH